MWLGAKIIANIINNIDLLIIPENKKITDGIIDNDKALKIVLFLKQTPHIKQYNIIKVVFIVR